MDCVCMMPIRGSTEGSVGALDPEETASGPPAPEPAVTAATESTPAEALKSQRRSHSPKNQASDDSSGGEEKHTVHAQRLGIDLPLDPQDEELVFQASRIFKIENLERLKKLRVRRTRRKKA